MMIDGKYARLLCAVAVVLFGAAAWAGPPAQLGEVTTTLVDAGAAPRATVSELPPVGATTRLSLRTLLSIDDGRPIEMRHTLAVRVARVDGDRATLQLEEPSTKLVATAVVTARGRLLSLDVTVPPSSNDKHARDGLVAMIDLIKEAWGSLGDLAPDAATGSGARWRSSRTLTKGALPTTNVTEHTRVAAKDGERLATRARLTVSGKLPAPAPPLESMVVNGTATVEMALLPAMPWPRRLTIAERVAYTVRESGKAETSAARTIKAELDFVPIP